MGDYRNLEVWKRAHRLVLNVYRQTAGFPQEERFGLTAQMRRAATSVPMNIAEGSGRGSNPDYARFLTITTGSLNELEYQLFLASELGFAQQTGLVEIQREVGEIRAMVIGFHHRLVSQAQPG